MAAAIVAAQASIAYVETLILEREGAATCHPVIVQSKGQIWSKIGQRRGI